MTPTRRPRRSALLQGIALLFAVVVLGACGRGNGADPAATGAPTDQSAATEAAPAETEATEATAGGGGGNGNRNGRTYTVERGDTLSSIAERFDTTVRALVRQNDLDDPDTIQVGQELRIPRRR